MKPLLTKQDNIQFFQNPDLTTDQLSDGSRLKSQTSKSVLCVLDDIDINFLQKRCHQNPEISTEGKRFLEEYVRIAKSNPYRFFVWQDHADAICDVREVLLTKELATKYYGQVLGKKYIGKKIILFFINKGEYPAILPIRDIEEEKKEAADILDRFYKTQDIPQDEQYF